MPESQHRFGNEGAITTFFERGNNYKPLSRIYTSNVVQAQRPWAHAYIPATQECRPTTVAQKLLIFDCDARVRMQ
jgi:hypothetical protein